MFEYTPYFEKDVLSKRPYIKKTWCEKVVLSRRFVKKQPDGRFRFWGRISEYGNQYLRVVTLYNKKTIHNAFFDRNFNEVK